MVSIKQRIGRWLWDHRPSWVRPWTTYVVVEWETRGAWRNPPHDPGDRIVAPEDAMYHEWSEDGFDFVGKREKDYIESWAAR